MPTAASIFGGLDGGYYNVSVVADRVRRQGRQYDAAGQPAGGHRHPRLERDEDVLLRPGRGRSRSTSTRRGTAARRCHDVTGDALVVLINNMTYPGYRYFGAVGTPDAPPLVATNIFPFPSTYTVYAGSCAADAPRRFGQPTRRVVVPRAAPSRSAAPVRIPSSRRSACRRSTCVVLGHRADRTGKRLERRPRRHHRHAGAPRDVKRTYSTDSSGRLTNPSLPYGTTRSAPTR